MQSSSMMKGVGLSAEISFWFLELIVGNTLAVAFFPTFKKLLSGIFDTLCADLKNTELV